MSETFRVFREKKIGLLGKFHHMSHGLAVLICICRTVWQATLRGRFTTIFYSADDTIQSMLCPMVVKRPGS